MSSPCVNALLIDAPVGRHFAQLHRNPKTLEESVGLFIETGLRRGNSVVVIATPDHIERFLDRLSRSDLRTEAYLKSGQLTMCYAEMMLDMFMRGGMPDWEAFLKKVGFALDKAKTFGKNVVRVYGEMVNTLWCEGQTQAAIRLEEYWNELARLHPFSLFCGYMLDYHMEERAGPLHEIGRTHSDIPATSDDELFQKALEAACRDVFGVTLPEMMRSSIQEVRSGEHRLPDAHRSTLWIMRNKASSSAEVLELARRYYQDFSSNPP